MVYHVTITTKSTLMDPVVKVNLSEDQVRERVVKPWEQGRGIFLAGRPIAPGDIDELTIHRTEQRASAYAAQVLEQRRQDASLPVSDDWYVAQMGDDVTDDFITGPAGAAVQSPTPKSPGAEDPRAVFVVHGRNEPARRGLFDFLRAIDLQPLEWSGLITSTGAGSPYIGQILAAAFRRAQAVVVLMTPDDEARLQEEFQQAHDPDYEKILTPQPRLNVVFEAGMAMAWDARRTILIEWGTLPRPYSDIVGRHSIRLVDTPECRTDIVERLRTAGCAVNTTGRRDWLSTGAFPKGGKHESGIGPKTDRDISSGIRRVREGDSQQPPSQAPRPAATPQDQASIDARIRVHQLHRDAQAAMAEGNWRQAEASVQQVLQHDAHFANARGALGIAAADTVRAQFYGQGHNQYGFDNQPQHDLAAMAIRWLEEARQWGEDSDGRVSAALGVMYGVTQCLEDMLGSLDVALQRDPAQRRNLAAAESLVCLLRACTADRDEDTARSVHDLGGRLHLRLPVTADDFQASIAAHAADASTRGRGQEWIAFARSSYWEKKDASERPAPLALVLIFVGRQQGGTEAKGRYFTRPNGHEVNVPEEPGTWLPATQLFPALDARFILFGQIGDIPPLAI